MIVSYVFADSQTYILLNSDLPNTSIIYTLLVGMAYTLQARSRYIDVPHAAKLI